MKIKTLFLIIASLITLSLQASTLHLILVIDAQAPQTGAETDAQLMKAQANLIGQITNMEVEVHEFNRRDDGLGAFVSSFRAGQNDVVWFYYSGHGRNASDGWPQFDNGEERYPMTDVFEVLQDNDARLNITMYDACNIGETQEAWSRTPNIPGNQLILLFKKTSGDIMIASSSDEQYSWGSTDTGGFMTCSFINALNNTRVSARDTPRSTWKKMLAAMREHANEMCRDIDKRPQNPKWHLDLSRQGGTGQGNDDTLTPENTPSNNSRSINLPNGLDKN